MTGALALDAAIENTQSRIHHHERIVSNLLPYPDQHRRAVEILLLFRDCLFELEETRRLLAQVPSDEPNPFV